MTPAFPSSHGLILTCAIRHVTGLHQVLLLWCCMRWQPFATLSILVSACFFCCSFLSPFLSFLYHHISPTIFSSISLPPKSISLVRESCPRCAGAALLFVVHLHFLLPMLSAATAIAGNSCWQVGGGGRGGKKGIEGEWVGALLRYPPPLCVACGGVDEVGWRLGGALAPACCCCCFGGGEGEGEGGWPPVAIAVRLTCCGPDGGCRVAGWR